MASRGVNKVILVGNLGQDPEVRYMPNGNAVANITVATSESWKDQQGQQQERTEWHRVVMFNKLGEIAGEYLRKGSQVYLEGKLQTRKWKDQSGQDRYTTEIVADQMQMLGSRPQNQGAQPNNFNQPQQQNQYAGQQAQFTPNQGGNYGNNNQTGYAPRQQQAQQTQSSQPAQQSGGYQQAAPSQRPATQAQPAQKPAQQNYTPDLDDNWDDDIPF